MEAPSRPTVLLDTNALFLPFEEGIDLVAEVRRWHDGAVLSVPDSVLRELLALERRRVPNASLALALAQRFPTIENRGKGDAAVESLARRLGAAVLTADRAMRDRLSADGLVVLVPRDRARLVPFGRRAGDPRRATVKNGSPVVQPVRRRRSTHA